MILWHNFGKCITSYVHTCCEILFQWTLAFKNSTSSMTRPVMTASGGRTTGATVDRRWPSPFGVPCGTFWSACSRKVASIFSVRHLSRAHLEHFAASGRVLLYRGFLWHLPAPRTGRLPGLLRGWRAQTLCILIRRLCEVV